MSLIDFFSVQQIKEIDQVGTHKAEKRTQGVEIRKGLEEQSIAKPPLTDAKSVVNLKIKPKSLKDFERLHRELSEGKLESTFERFTYVLQKELNAPKLKISANLQKSAIQKGSDISFTCVNAIRLQLIREDVEHVVVCYTCTYK